MPWKERGAEVVIVSPCWDRGGGCIGVPGSARRGLRRAAFSLGNRARGVNGPDGVFGVTPTQGLLGSGADSGNAARH